MFSCHSSSHLQWVLSTNLFPSSNEQLLIDRRLLLWTCDVPWQNRYCLHDASCLNHFLVFPEFSVPASLDLNGNSNFLCLCQSSQGVLKIRKHTFCLEWEFYWTEPLWRRYILKSGETWGTCTTAICIKDFQFWAMVSWIQRGFHCLSFLRLGLVNGSCTLLRKSYPFIS